MDDRVAGRPEGTGQTRYCECAEPLVEDGPRAKARKRYTTLCRRCRQPVRRKIAAEQTTLKIEESQSAPNHDKETTT